MSRFVYGRIGLTSAGTIGLLVLTLLLGGCSPGGTANSSTHRASGQSSRALSTSVTGMGPGMMNHGGAPRMMGRGSGSPPPAVTIAPTATPGGNAPISFGKDVLPILTSQCASCHGGQGGLWLDSYEHIMAGGASGPDVVPGNPEASLLYQRITGEKTPQMPLNNPPLTGAEIAAVKGWIAEGAPKN